MEKYLWKVWESGKISRSGEKIFGENISGRVGKTKPKCSHNGEHTTSLLAISFINIPWLANKREVDEHIQWSEKMRSHQMQTGERERDGLGKFESTDVNPRLHLGFTAHTNFQNLPNSLSRVRIRLYNHGRLFCIA